MNKALFLKVMRSRKRHKRQKKVVSDKASYVYGKLTKVYADEFDKLKSNEMNEIAAQNEPNNISLEGSNYEGWFSENEESDNKILEGDKEKFVDKSSMLPLEGHEKEAREGTGIKMFSTIV